MTLKSGLLNATGVFLRSGWSLFPGRLKSRLHRAIFVRSIDIDGRSIRFFCPNDFTRWRVDTLFTKEPETIEWLDRLQPGHTLLDVGANIGLYSLYAAVKGCRVFAFEPESQNFFVLNRNIYLNSLDSLVTAYPMGFSDTSGATELYLSNYSIMGGSGNSLGECLNYRLEELDPVFVQGTYSLLIDDFVAQRGVVPTHLKIDVDGFEHLVIAGAQETLKSPTLRSILIEINTKVEQHRMLVDQICEAGFVFSDDQVEQSRCTEGLFAGIANYIFTRSEN